MLTNKYYTYDAAGNPTSILDASGIGRDMVWDAENRLKEIIDTEKGLFHSYAYDHTGERILKRYGTAQNAYYNGKDMGTLYDFGESYSAYVSPYFVESNNGYTKHYYAGATRLVSKIGESVYENESYISYGDKEKKQYFYFQDHLGSSTYITDLNGDIAQYSAYTPYGEMFREYNNVTPFRFNGKELDTETGLYYYGARYYNPSTALWLGVDPLASKYPGVSPYIYCMSNPVKYVDPDGRDWYRASDESIMWTDYTSQEEMNEHNIKGTYLDKVVVTFNGSMNERLGVDNNLFTEGAVLAEATVYGKNRDDIQSYGAFTMTSDYEKFGAIADGTYIVNYRDPGKTGSLKSNWALNNAGPVDCINGKNPSPIDPYSSTQKNGVYIHRSNKNGWAGVSKNGESAVSTGCLLIVPSREGKNIGWNEFNQQLTGVKRFTLILKRD